MPKSTVPSRRVSVFSLLLLTASCTLAQQTASMPVTPSGAFRFSGKWNCKGSFRNGKIHQASFEAAVILDDKWLELTERDVVPTTGYVAKYLIGYDPQQKRLVEFDANNFGAAMYTSEQGWQNGVLTMTSAIAQDPKASYAINRFLYTVRDGSHFDVDWQVSKTAAPDWIQSDHLSCAPAAEG